MTIARTDERTLEGARLILRRQLGRRFEVDAEVEQRLTEADLTQLNLWSDRVLHAGCDKTSLFAPPRPAEAIRMLTRSEAKRRVFLDFLRTRMQVSEDLETWISIAGDEKLVSWAYQLDIQALEPDEVFRGWTAANMLHTQGWLEGALGCRFELSADVVAKLRAGSMRDLLCWVRRAFDVERPEDLFGSGEARHGST